MPTRPCDICLALQDDSVFADFALDEEGQLYLVRISFDGYGCCYPSWKEAPIKIESGVSQQLLEKVEKDNVATKDVANILSAYFINCGEAIWVDALQTHELI
ncbi:hypothetical protein [Marinicella litoralis]|nr:hypothetical protein [Marinicella litoralis]